jgi:transposase
MTRQKVTARFKTQVVQEALKERMTMAGLAQKFKVSPVQICSWKREFPSNAESVFGKKTKSEEKSEADLEKERLLQTIHNTVWSGVPEIPTYHCFIQFALFKPILNVFCNCGSSFAKKHSHL